MTIRTPLTVDIAGLEKLGMATGYIMIVSGIAGTTSGPILGEPKSIHISEVISKRNGKYKNCCLIKNTRAKASHENYSVFSL